MFYKRSSSLSAMYNLEAHEVENSISIMVKGHLPHFSYGFGLVGSAAILKFQEIVDISIEDNEVTLTTNCDIERIQIDVEKQEYKPLKYTPNDLDYLFLDLYFGPMYRPLVEKILGKPKLEYERDKYNNPSIDGVIQYEKGDLMFPKGDTGIREYFDCLDSAIGHLIIHNWYHVSRTETSAFGNEIAIEEEVTVLTFTKEFLRDLIKREFKVIEGNANDKTPKRKRKWDKRMMEV